VAPHFLIETKQHSGDIMRISALAFALGGALALAIPAVPAFAAYESLEARQAAAAAVDEARADMREVFGKKTLKAGQYLWRPGREKDEVTRVVIGLREQLAYAYSGRELIAVSTISSGKNKTPTPTGIFPILEKKTMHRSRKYDDAPMPFMQRLDEYGIAMHAGQLPGRPASHGCVRLPAEFAKKLFAATEVGTEVMIGARMELASAN
jgi:hypothetical protein